MVGEIPAPYPCTSTLIHGVMRDVPPHGVPSVVASALLAVGAALLLYGLTHEDERHPRPWLIIVAIVATTAVVTVLAREVSTAR